MAMGQSRLFKGETWATGKAARRMRISPGMPWSRGLFRSSRRREPGCAQSDGVVPRCPGQNTSQEACSVKPT